MYNSNYATKTKISVSQSQNEIKDLLVKYGCNKFAFDLDNNAILFELNGNPIKISVPLPNRDDFKLTPTGRNKTSSKIDDDFSQDIKARWRLMRKYIEVKLELVRLNILSIQQVFFSDHILLNGKTFSEEFIPKLKKGNVAEFYLPSEKKD